ncbi:MAG TPA: EAL domain-containing protein [Halanaerobiales bacterium]|nr:EAL domain-containing protein [Halanaerobiales bacterium]
MKGNEEQGCFRELLNEVSAQVVAFNKNYEIKWANQKAKDYLNYGKELKDKNCRQLFFENDFSIKESEIEECPFEEIFQKNKKITEELTNNQGETWEIQWFSSEKDDKEIGYMIAYNITKPKRIENKLKERSEVFYQVRSKFHESQEKFQSLFVHNPDAICAIDLKGKVLSANPALEDITAYKPDGIIGSKFIDLIKKSDTRRVQNYLHRVSSGKNVEYETSIVTADNKEVIVNIKSFPMVVEGEIVAIYSIIKNITEKKKFEKKLREIAYYDDLTGLPNKNYLEDKIDKILEKDQKAAILFLDLDRFKRINDSLGHKTGDEVIKRTAKRLNKIVYGGIVARYSGDEFIIILEDIKNREDAVNKVEEITNEFSTSFMVNKRNIYLSLSMGVAIYPDDGVDKSDLIKYAYLSMHKAKDKMEKWYHFFDAGLMNEKIGEEKLNMEGELRKAIKNNDFYLKYQPQIDLYNGEIAGFEALIRWDHEKLGKISPGEFIPLAEETGLIKEIGRWVIKEACRQVKVWREEGHKPVKMAINVSIHQLKDPNFIEEIKEIIRGNELNPQYLELEITENIMRNLNELEVILDKLKEIGVQISIDDFGTGYSSLSVLQGLPINTLKIDKSFIINSTNDEKSATLVKTIINMAKNLDLNIIAEGVEERTQVDLLRSNDCRTGQGFLFSRPLPVSDITDILDFDSSGFILDTV